MAQRMPWMKAWERLDDITRTSSLRVEGRQTDLGVMAFADAGVINYNVFCRASDDATFTRATTMAIMEQQQPPNLPVPIYEDPPGVFRVGNSRVLLELVIRAFQRGQTPEGIVQSYDTLSLPDVYAVVSYYLARPAAIESYLRSCDQRANEVRQKLEAAGMIGGGGKEELLARARAKGVLGDSASD